jgi:hypothetical protein
MEIVRVLGGVGGARKHTLTGTQRFHAPAALQRMLLYQGRLTTKVTFDSRWLDVAFDSNCQWVLLAEFAPLHRLAWAAHLHDPDRSFAPAQPAHMPDA